MRGTERAYVPGGPEARSTGPATLPCLDDAGPAGNAKVVFSYDAQATATGDDHLLALGAFESLMGGVTRQRGRSRRREMDEFPYRSERLRATRRGHLGR